MPRKVVLRLKGEGISVVHVILSASRATLIERLHKRLEFGDSWGKRQIDHCLHAFETAICEEKIHTDKLSVDEVVQSIASIAGLSLMPDPRGKFKKIWDRVITSVRHIRD